MRGAPWIRFLLMAAVLALLAIPLWLLTRADAQSPPKAPAGLSLLAERDVTIEIETAPAAQALRLSYLGRELIPPSHTTGTFSGEIRVPVGLTADLVIRARWSGAQRSALRVRAFDENGPLAEASFWAAEEMQEVFTIPEVPH
jgi:hypothetical protein